MELLVDGDIFKFQLFLLFSALWLYWLWMRRNLYLFALKFPCSFGLPLLGVALRVRHPKYALRFTTELFLKTKRNTINIWMGLYLHMITSDPVLIEAILSSPELLDKAITMYQPLYNALQGGILSSPAKEWYSHRKHINPSFSHKVILSLLPIFNKAKKEMLSKFDTLVGTGEHKLNELLLQTTMRISTETTMGKVVNEDDKVDGNLAKEFLYCLEAIVTQIMFNFVKLQWLPLLNPRFHKAKNYVCNFIHELVICKLQFLHENQKNGDQLEKKTNSETDNSVLEIKKTPNIFIDQAIQLYQQQKFTWNDIIAESNTIMVASIETIASTILSTLIMLAMHTDVQEKLYEEIVSVFPEKDFEMEYEHMEKLPYLDMVINETMRLEPAAPIIARQATKDTQLTKNILLPKNLQILISIFYLHRNTEIWGPNANKFNPDNFLPENVEGKHSHAFIPFSKGARNCIGWRYALFAMKILLAGCVRNLRFTTTFKFEDLEYLERVTIKYLVEPGIEIHHR